MTDPKRGGEGQQRELRYEHVLVDDGLPLTDADGALRDYSVWVGSPFDDAIDKYYEQHLQLLEIHPGFQAQLDALSSGPADDSSKQAQLEGAAGRWGIALEDLKALLDASQSSLPAHAGSVHLEIRPHEYVVRIPRPVTAPRREAVEALVKDLGNWKRLVEDREVGDQWVTPRKSSLAPKTMERKDWYGRWLRNETAFSISDSLPDGDLSEDNVRTTLRDLHRRLSEISPAGLPDKAP